MSERHASWDEAVLHEKSLGERLEERGVDMQDFASVLVRMCADCGIDEKGLQRSAVVIAFGRGFLIGWELNAQRVAVELPTVE